MTQTLKHDKLNIGSGLFRKEGYFNVDIDNTAHPDLVYDLNRIPYPFENGTFVRIEADHVLEHLEDPFKVMKELHRILKDDGVLVVRVPHFSRGFTHADHRRGFDITFPYYFNREYKGGYCGCDFKIKSTKLKWYAQPYLAKTVLNPIQHYGGFILGTIFTFLANLSPIFCSRLWCYWVGGFEQIEYTFVKEGK